MLKPTITENKLITLQTIKQSFDNIKKAALIEGTQVNQQLKTFNTLVTLTKWKNSKVLNNFNLLIEIDVVENSIKLRICESDGGISKVSDYHLSDSWDSISYLVPYDDSLNIISSAFVQKFTVDKAISKIDEYVFTPIWKNINRLSLANSSIFLTNIDIENRQASLDLQLKNAFYDENTYDFNDFKPFDEDSWLFSTRDCKDKFLQNIILPINMFPAEDIIKLITTESGPMFETNGLDFIISYGIGKMVYYLDFEKYADKQRLIELIRQNHLISLFPELKYWQKATDKFKELVLKDIRNLNLSVLSECFDKKYSFKLNADGTLMNNDLNYLMWILFEQIALEINDTNNNASDTFKNKFIKAVWNFVEKYFVNPKFTSVENMLTTQQINLSRKIYELSNAFILNLNDLTPKNENEDLLVQRIINAISAKMQSETRVRPDYCTKYYIFNNQKIREQLKTANDKDATINFSLKEIDGIIDTINQYLPTTDNIDKLSIRCLKLKHNLFFVNVLNNNEILD